MYETSSLDLVGEGGGPSIQLEWFQIETPNRVFSDFKCLSFSYAEQVEHSSQHAQYMSLFTITLII